MEKSKLVFSSLFVVLAAIVLSCGLTAPKVVNNNQHPGLINLRGVNAVAGEIAWKGEGVPVVSGTNYQFLQPADIDYLVSKKINFIRLVYSWEYLQPTLNADFPDTEYNRKFTETVNYMTSKGLYVMVEPHGGSDPNFFRYKGSPVGSAQFPISAFANFWKFMSLKFKSNDRVLYGLGNEPHTIDTATVFAAQQAAIDAIRATGSRQMIMIELNHFDHIYTLNETWTDPSRKMTNAQAMLTIKDPINNTVVEMHEYFSNAGSGTNSDIESVVATVNRVKKGVDWARANNIKLFLGEFGADKNNPLAQQAVINLLDYLNDNSDVVLGWAWWAAGPYSWWSNYRFSLLTSKNNTTDDVKMSWLTPYLVGVNTASPTLAPLVPDAGAVVDAGTPDASSTSDAGSCKLIVQSRTTMTSSTQTCMEFDIVNKCKAPLTWSSATINLFDGFIVNTKPDIWNVDAGSKTGVIQFTAPAWMQNVQPNTKNTFGLCETLGAGKIAAKFVELK